MNRGHEPEGYTTVSPYLTVDGATGTIDFLTRALDAGAAVVQRPAQGGDEDKRGCVTDASGTTWWFATKVD